MSESEGNYIRRVLFRVDFPIGIGDLRGEKRPVAFQKALLNRLPVVQEQPHTGVEFVVGAQVGEPRAITKTTYHFRSDDGADRASLDADYLSVEMKRFSSFSGFRSLVEVAVNGLFEAYPDTTVNRVGLRYVNVIPPEVASGTDGIATLVADSLLPAVSFYDGERLTRVLTTAELSEGAKRTRVVSGYANPDYPGLLMRREFLIDIDVYTQQVVPQEGVVTLLDDFQQSAKREFRRCVRGRLLELVENG